MNDTTPNPTNKFLNHLNNLIKLYGVDGPVHPTAITVDEGEWKEIKALIDEHAAKTLSADTLNSKYCALKESAAEMLAYIEMTMAHSGAQSVEGIMQALKLVQTVSSVETYHHCGCAKTTRRVDLTAAREAVAGTLQRTKSQAIEAAAAKAYEAFDCEGIVNTFCSGPKYAASLALTSALAGVVARRKPAPPGCPTAS